MIKVQGSKILIDTLTLTAVMDKGYIISLKSKLNGEEYLSNVQADIGSALQLIYPFDEEVNILDSGFDSISCWQVSDHCAEIRMGGWDGNGVIIVSEDLENGDLVVEPSAFSARPGVRSCRWNIKGIREDLELVAPLYQGVKLKLDDPLIRNTRWNWPKAWEAGLAILQGRDSGFWVHTRDTRFRYKLLKIGSQTDAHCLGFESDTYGPIDNNLSAGGLSWRLNVYQGDWQVPAGKYRDWLWEAYKLDKRERQRKEWLFELKMAISWCPGDPEILDELAKKVAPSKVLQRSTL